MRIQGLSQFVLISLFQILFVATARDPTQCLDDQRSLLLQLRSSLEFNPTSSAKLVTWNQRDDCCRWGGVDCDGAGRVISLNLENETITGGIENSSLFRLQHLQELNLAYNFFNSSQIPKGVQNLTNLAYLNLSNAGFGGQIPVEVSTLSSLRSFDLSTLFGGAQPLKLENPNLQSLVQNLSRLRELYLDNVNISSQRSEWCQALSSSLPNLTALRLRTCGLSGPLDSSLAELRSLSVLRLNRNNLSTTVPEFIAKFPNLTTLTFGNCFLQGTFPDTIFQVQTLQILDLSNNKQLNGTIPNLPVRSSLKSIVLSYTDFSGPLPDSIGNLRMLSRIDLSNCNFTGLIPTTISNLTELVHMDFSLNSFTGLIPPFSMSSKLTYVDLFSGTFNLEKVQGLPNLTRLELGYNNLSVVTSNSSLLRLPQLSRLSLASCNLSGFPDLRNQSELTFLDLSRNSIKGEVPSWIWNIGNGFLTYLNLSRNLLVDLQKPFTVPPNLGVLDLHSNSFRGEFPLPPSSAIYVDYSSNNFQQAIPANIGDLVSSALFFSLANNHLTGTVPPSLCNATYLQVLDLSGNNLTGSIPNCLANSYSLAVLNLRRNKISGDIPDLFSSACGLKTLDLSQNNLRGKIPLSMANCTSLEVLNVGHNKIEGTFPCRLKTSSSLRVLVLHSNRFHGNIGCSEVNGSWPNLQIIDIASNNFSGEINPQSIASWRGMMLDNNRQLMGTHIHFEFLSNFYYQDAVTVTIKGQELELVKILTVFTAIDFSCNNFSGAIPETVGDLTSLYILNLSHNSFSGVIPSSIGKLTQLGSLDLSVNQLTGGIPEKLTSLNFLSFLNLSYNMLVGVIPTGSQFQTFSASSFEGNSGLCGFPSNTSCISDSHLNKREHDWQLIITGVGYGVGLLLVFVPVALCRQWREYYSKQLDQFLSLLFPSYGFTNSRGRRRV